MWFFSANNHYHISNKYPGYYLSIFGNGLLVEDFLLFLFDTSYNPFFSFQLQSFNVPC